MVENKNTNNVSIVKDEAAALVNAFVKETNVCIVGCTRHDITRRIAHRGSIDDITVYIDDMTPVQQHSNVKYTLASYSMAIDAITCSPKLGIFIVMNPDMKSIELMALVSETCSSPTRKLCVHTIDMRMALKIN